MSCVGIFDSGLGGLTVWHALRQLAPQLSCLYLADQANVPYGPRSDADIRALSRSMTAALLDQGAELIVLACNTASAAALHELREQHPAVSFVGMEPAVKPAALHTKTGVVGLMATQGTLKGRLLQNTARQFTGHVELISSDCPGLAQAIECQAPESELIALLEHQLAPMKAAKADTVVLGCTHYPLIRELIQQVLGPDVSLIDPAPAVARQILRLWPRDTDATASPLNRFVSTGEPAQLQRFLEQHFALSCEVEHWPWQQGKLRSTPSN